MGGIHPEKTITSEMDTDKALHVLGALGRWQVTHFIIISCVSLFQGCFLAFGIVFVGEETPHHCRIPPGNDLNLSVPYENKNGLWVPVKCEAYINFTHETNTTEPCPDGWQYESETYSIVNEWDLVCDRNNIVDMTQMAFIGGVMLGSVMMTTLSDYCGRKPVLLASLALSGVIGCLTAVVKSPTSFIITRFLCGICQMGINLSSFVLVCELFPASKRTLAGILFQMFWAFAMCILAGQAYFIRHWRHLQMAISTPGFLGIPLFWVIPESIPWLVAKNRIKEAKKLLQIGARWNNVILPREFRLELDAEEKKPGNIVKESKSNCEDIGKISNGRIEDDTKPVKPGRSWNFDCCKKSQKSSSQDYSLMDILRSRKLLFFTVVMMYLWCVNGLIYFGLALSTGTLSGNLYLNFAISGLVEIPAALVNTYIMQTVGRRWPTFIFLIVAAVPLCLCAVISHFAGTGGDMAIAVIILSMIGKLGITGSFSAVFLYSPELYPTTLRNTGIGLASLGGRIGNIFAPLSAYLAKTRPILVAGIFGGMALFASFLVLLLPETLGRPLPTSVAEVEKWTRTVSKEERERYMHTHHGKNVKGETFQEKAPREAAPLTTC